MVQPACDSFCTTWMMLLAMDKPPQEPPELISKGPWWFMNSNFPQEKHQVPKMTRENKTVGLASTLVLKNFIKKNWHAYSMWRNQLSDLKSSAIQCDNLSLEKLHPASTSCIVLQAHPLHTTSPIVVRPHVLQVRMDPGSGAPRDLRSRSWGHSVGFWLLVKWFEGSFPNTLRIEIF